MSPRFAKQTNLPPFPHPSSDDVFVCMCVCQTIDEARDYNTRRIKAVQENIAQLEQLVQKKRALRDGATYVIQQKIAQQTGAAH